MYTIQEQARSFSGERVGRLDQELERSNILYLDWDVDYMDGYIYQNSLHLCAYYYYLIYTLIKIKIEEKYFLNTDNFLNQYIQGKIVNVLINSQIIIKNNTIMNII